MTTVTILWGHPVDASRFDACYSGTHLPLAGEIDGVARAALTRFLRGPDGTPPPWYRMAELVVDSPARMRASPASSLGKATLADLPNFATVGVTSIVGAILT